MTEENKVDEPEAPEILAEAPETAPEVEEIASEQPETATEEEAATEPQRKAEIRKNMHVNERGSTQRRQDLKNS